MNIQRFNTEKFYGAKVVIDGVNYGELLAHTDWTRANPEAVERFIDHRVQSLAATFESMRLPDNL